LAQCDKGEKVVVARQVSRDVDPVSGLVSAIYGENKGKREETYDMKVKKSVMSSDLLAKVFPDTFFFRREAISSSCSTCQLYMVLPCE
jgi:hypothetical protein